MKDGREICTSCQESIVVDTKDCQPLYDDILKEYSTLGLGLLERTPLALVDAQALNDHSVKQGSHGVQRTSETRGMTLTEEST